MLERTDAKKILIVGAGSIIIGCNEYELEVMRDTVD